MEDLKPVLAKNIAALRKSINWTQAELAQKLNYSDKAVSKWERAESLPDVAVLKEIACLFNVKLDYLVEAEHAEEEPPQPAASRHLVRRNGLFVALVSAAFVYLVATIVYVVLELYSVHISQPAWMLYVYAIPVSCVLFLIFNSIWGKGKVNFAIISALLWSILLSVYLSYLQQNLWLIFVIGIPAQVIILLSAGFKLKIK